MSSKAPISPIFLKDKTYFKEGKWSIVTNEAIHPYSHLTGFSAIKHKCKSYWRSHVTRPLNIWKVDRPICEHCNEPIPEGIMGLWTLHNWDAMQGQHSQEERWIGRPGQVWDYIPAKLGRVPQ